MKSKEKQMRIAPPEETTGPISRRDFFKVGCASGAMGAALGAAFLSGNSGKFADQVAKLSVRHRKGFPVLITNKCSQMDQKNTVFARSFWDKKLTKFLRGKKEYTKTMKFDEIKGWTPLDQALDAAGWAVDNAFATGSELGQPQSSAYKWDAPVRDQQVKFKDPEDAAKKVKKAARYLGASLTGITAYDPLWDYSQLINLPEREESQNERPELKTMPVDFPFKPNSVIVVAIEMDYRSIALSPSALEGAAVGLGYSQMAFTGFSIATFLRELGYRSFACGNDVSLSIPYAIAAGLGELGRNGMLVTREFGPRVRLVKIYTELEIKPDNPKTFGVWEFCKSCKRCAEACPSGSIPLGKPTLEGKTLSNNPGVLKWYIDPEKCYKFWRENDSDCANCITSCPFNKPSMWHHKLISTISSIPSSPLHSLMARMDKHFGFGTTYDMKGNAEFWEREN